MAIIYNKTFNKFMKLILDYYKGDYMEELTEKLLDILEGLNKKDEQIDEILSMLTHNNNNNNCGPGYFIDLEENVELALIMSLGGTKEVASIFSNAHYDDPFYNFRLGYTDREELIWQIKFTVFTGKLRD